MKSFQIGKHRIGEGNSVYVILEAGSNWLDLNHSEDLEYGFKQAKRMIETAKEAGADAIKFQIFSAKEHVSSKAKTPSYLNKTTSKSLFEIIHDLELPRQWIKDLDAYCQKCGIDFLTSPCDRAAVDQLLKETNPLAFKIASYDIVDLDFLKFIAAKRKPMILSTGMASEDEVKEAVAAIVEEGNNQICLLHCVSCYPAPLNELSLRSIETLEKLTDLPIGFSDHTTDTTTASIAVSVGACMIEKHFTLDRNQRGPDHTFALNPQESKEMILRIRETESMLCDGKLGVKKCEAQLYETSRRVLVVGPSGIKAGEKFNPKHFIVKRGNGILPRNLNQIIGKSAKRNFEFDEILKWEDL